MPVQPTRNPKNPQAIGTGTSWVTGRTVQLSELSLWRTHYICITCVLKERSAPSQSCIPHFHYVNLMLPGKNEETKIYPETYAVFLAQPGMHSVLSK